MAKRSSRKMTDDELESLVHAHVIQSVGYIGGTLSQQRQTAMEYYQSELFGDEQDGRSQVVLSDVQDTIEWMLPSLIEIFVANDKAVMFTPTGEEDVEAAEQETDYVNHVFNQDNQGFMLLYSWFKDALLSKNGIAKAWADQSKTVAEDYYEGLTEIQLAQLSEDPEIEFIGITERADEELGAFVYDVRVRVTKSKRKIRTAAVPPEEFLISRRAISIDDAEFVGHRMRKTQSELILMGYDRDTVENLPSHDEGEFNEERSTRFARDEEYAYATDAAVNHPASREIWINECYIRVDYDGDGIAELRRVVVGGDGDTGTILENEVWPHSRPPFYSITPVPITHKFFGLSIADLTMDLQKIRSTLLRQMLDAQYLANNPRHAVVKGETEIEDLLTVRPGGIVRIDRPEAAPQPILTQPPSPTTYQLLEFITGERESRTGITKYGQGLDSGTLNDTASGINQLMTAAQLRIKLIARIFAETGVRELFTGIHELVRKYQDTSRMIRLRNNWVDVDPRQWAERMDMTIEVGLGAGNREMQLMHLDGLAATQAAIVQVQGGVDGPIVEAKHVYNLGNKRAELAGFKQADIFFGDPEDPKAQQKQQQRQQQQQQPPDPAVIKAQADMQKAQAELQQKAQEAQQKAQEAQAKLAQEAEATAAKLGVEYEKLALAKSEHEDKMALEFAKLEAEREAGSAEMIARHVEKAGAEEARYLREAELLRQKDGYESAKAARETEMAEREAAPRSKDVEVVRDASGRITGARIREEGVPDRGVSVNRGADGTIQGATVE